MYATTSQNISLRRKALEFAIEALSELKLDFEKAENAIRAEIEGNQKDSNLWMTRILLDLDEESNK